MTTISRVIIIISSHLISYFIYMYMFNELIMFTLPFDFVGKSSDEGEKTFAIIIGLLAGAALLIIFLAFIRKVIEGGESGNISTWS